jgi:hypothetical protein
VRDAAADDVQEGSRGRWDGPLRKLPWLAPCFVVLGGAYWTAVGAYGLTFAILGRDPGIFQYVAWAIGRGQRDYADFREINGPLPHLIHLFFMQLGGGDEHVFRTLDLVSEVAVFALVGALLPGLGRRKGDASEIPVGPGERLAWAAAASVALTAQYLEHGWWQTAQRESFYDLFLLLSVGLQLRVQSAGRGPLAVRARPWLLVLAGASGAIPWFGKPTNLVFSALQVGALLVDDEVEFDKRRAVGWFAAGCAVITAAMIAFTFAIGDPARGVHIVFGEVPRLYRWIWKLSIADAYSAWGNAPKLNYAFATLVVTLGLIATRRLPRRLLVPTTLLAGGLLNFFVQGKGFPYHLHPITAGTHLVWLASLAWGAERARLSSRHRVTDRFAHALPPAVLAASVLMGYQASTEARLSEYTEKAWWRAGATAEGRASEGYFRQFPWGDYFPWELRQAAAYLRAATGPDERVQTYGMDPYILFLARRLSATPYIYSFELNVDAALQGGSGGAPDPAERAWLLEAARRHESEMLEDLQRQPPAAFTFIDRAPFTHPEDAVVDFDLHCPRTAAWLRGGYRETARFGAVHVWLRRDVAARDASGASATP